MKPPEVPLSPDPEKHVAPQRSGIDCPKCKAFIELKIEELLRKSIFRCKQCGLELTLNRFQSRDPLEALSKMQSAADEFKAAERLRLENTDDQPK